MTILVLGATGTIGREVVGGLVAAGQPVRALTRDADRARCLVSSAEIVEGDVTNPVGVASALHGVTGVIATHGGDSDPQRVYYGAVRALITALSERGALTSTPVALMSSINVTRPSGSYANLMNWKRRGERLLRVSGTPVTVIRPGWFEPLGTTPRHPILKQGDAVQFGPVAVEHVAEALIAALQNPGHTAELFTEPGAATHDWGRAFGSIAPDQPRALDGAGDPGSLPEDQEPDHVQADLAWARAR